MKANDHSAVLSALAICAIGLNGYLSECLAADEAPIDQDAAAIGELMRRLTPTQQEKLSEPLGEDSTVRRVPLVIADEKRTLWLTSKKHVRCAYFAATYEYEGIVTEGSSNGPEYAVAKIDVFITREVDDANYTHSCENRSWCPKTDKVTATFGACGKTYTKACATNKGKQWCTAWH